MRKLIVAAGLMLPFSAGWVFGREYKYNAASWRELGHLERVLYVRGFSDGRVIGIDQGRKGIAEMIAKVFPPSSWTNEQKQKIAELATHEDEKAEARPHLTIGEVEGNISTFYGDYRNASVCWQSAALFSQESLLGNTPTEQELADAREAGAKNGCK